MPIFWPKIEISNLFSLAEFLPDFQNSDTQIFKKTRTFQRKGLKF